MGKTELSPELMTEQQEVLDAIALITEMPNPEDRLKAWLYLRHVAEKKAVQTVREIEETRRVPGIF